MWIAGKELKCPSLMTIQLPNDHIAKARPEDGYTAVRIRLWQTMTWHWVEYSTSCLELKYWKNMLVIITEDDPQGGVDHIDAHRSILMMAGPYM
jgi:hypothetical protein